MISCCTLLTVAILFFAPGQVVTAQVRPVYHSQHYIGLLDGATASSFQVQTIHGVRYQQWFGGAGLGLDHYYYRTVPLFLSFTRYMGSENRGFFFSIDGGTNFFWGHQHKYYPGTPTGGSGDFSPSWYYTGSAGYRLELKDSKDAVLLNIGYSVKQLTETIGAACINPPCSVDRYDYRLNRLSLRLGLSF